MKSFWHVMFWVSFWVVVFAVFLGVGKLLHWDAERDAKDRQAACAQVAELSQAEDWVEKDYNCFIIKDNKFIEIK